jgi:hypothetical protein
MLRSASSSPACLLFNAWVVWSKRARPSSVAAHELAGIAMAQLAGERTYCIGGILLGFGEINV